MYTQQESLEAYADKKVELVVNTGIYHDQVEQKLPDSYRAADMSATGISILLLILALPLYIIFSWIFATLSVFASLGVFLYFKKLNYRVFIRAKVKEDEAFFDWCQKNAVIRLVEKI